MADRKPILVLDFDGVIHSYASGWKGADVIPDPPVPGAMEFIRQARKAFTVAIYSSRSGQAGGIAAMQAWLQEHMRLDTLSYGIVSDHDADAIARILVYEDIQWPTEKPPAMVTLDDRALTFTGVWPDLEDLLTFQPWNKRAKTETSNG